MRACSSRPFCSGDGRHAGLLYLAAGYRYTALLSDLAAKQVELLHELVPKAAVLGFLVNPNDPTSEAATRDAQAAAEALGHTLVIANASAASAIEPAFALLAPQHIAALFVNADPLYNQWC